MIVEFSCKCGADSTKDAKHYDGALGYETVVCQRCARYYDSFGEQKPDNWSKEFVGVVNCQVE